MLYDVFISHASEDKDDFVRKLAVELQKRNVEVWYDEFTLKIGDSLRQSIDKGLLKSKYGVVVLSENFFRKKWTNWELDGLIQKQNDANENILIPIWYQIEKAQIFHYSPSLADKIAILSIKGIEHVADKIASIIHPKGSTMLAARDYLLSKGFEAPVISDEWWIQILENSKQNGKYLSFNNPFSKNDDKSRGKYFGELALQMLWDENAEVNKISQLTHPAEVVNFVNTQPRLKEAMISEPLRAALYFPQLTISPYGKFLERGFKRLLNEDQSVINGNWIGPLYATAYSSFIELALRHPEYGRYNCQQLAGFYFMGKNSGYKYSTKRNRLFDCIMWLLSEKASWLPAKIRDMLIDGLSELGGWTWSSNELELLQIYEYNKIMPDCFANWIEEEYMYPFRRSHMYMGRFEKLDLDIRIGYSKFILKLPESVEALTKVFLDKQFIEKEMARRRQQQFGS